METASTLPYRALLDKKNLRRVFGSNQGLVIPAGLRLIFIFVKIIYSPRAMQRQSAIWARENTVIGVVPTMGALHEGHLELVRRARADCTRVIVTIYVNPTQFGPKEDLARYPRPRRMDLALCRQAGVDAVFAPSNLYRRDASTFVEETALSQGRDGSSRPGHFRGVATVVLKLFNLTRPTRAYFGQKDAQQLDVIRRMVRDLDVPVKIVAVPTVRAHDGVALSSRNRYLSGPDREVAAQFARLVQEASKLGPKSAHWLSSELKKIAGLRLDYAEVVAGRLNVAVWIGQTRLIDNERMRSPR